MEKLNVEFRTEQAPDYRIVEELTREAFWNHFVPGCNEHYLVHIMRNSKAFIKELDFVAVFNQQIVANIMYTKAMVLDDNEKEHEVVSFGPISVGLEYQGRGFGTRLIEHTKKIARHLGHKAILIYGDPAFYSRVGFVPAEKFGIATRDNMYAVALQACELVEGALSGCRGRFFEDSIYKIDEPAAQKFDESFPPKNYISDLPSQKRFLEFIQMKHPRK